MKPYSNSTVVTKGVMNGIRAELANVVTQSGQACSGGVDTVDEAFGQQVYMAVQITSGSVTDFISDNGASGQITISRSRTPSNNLILPLSYPLLDGFTARFSLQVAKTNDGSGVGNEGYYYIQFNTNIVQGDNLPARRIAYMNGTSITDLAIGSIDLPLNKTVEVFYRDVTTGTAYTPKAMGGGVLAETTGRWILTSQSASLIKFADKQSIYLPNGFIMKTGTITTCSRDAVSYTFDGTTTTLVSGHATGGDLVSGNYTASVTFTTAFPTALVSVFPIFKTDAGNNITTSIRASSSTGFTIEFSETSSSVQQITEIMWQAIGY